jgi:hypothetical protein
LKRGLRPQTEIEHTLVEAMSATVWRMRRAWALENRMLNQKLVDPNGPDFPLGPDVQPFPDQPFDRVTIHEATDEEYIQEMDRMAAAWTAMANKSEFRSILSRESELHRTFLKYLREFRLKQKEERQAPIQNPAKEPEKQNYLTKGKACEIKNLPEGDSERREKP